MKITKFGKRPRIVLSLALTLIVAVSLGLLLLNNDHRLQNEEEAALPEERASDAQASPPPAEAPVAAPMVYEAEAPGNTLTGNALVQACGDAVQCSGGGKVAGMWGGSAVQFNDVTAPSAGVYTLRTFYISGDLRPVSVRVNDNEPETLTPPKTENWDTVGVFELEVRLREGGNTISFEDGGGWSPDFDRIELVASQEPAANYIAAEGIDDIGAELASVQYGSVAVKEHERGATFSNGVYTIVYNTDSGLAAYAWDDRTIVRGVYGSVRLDWQLDSLDYGEHRFDMSHVERVRDGHGEGVRVTIVNVQPGLPAMKQVYYLYDHQPYFLAGLEVDGETEIIGTNRIAPIALNSVGGVDIGSYADNRVLVVPFDNDMWSRYQSRTINTDLNTHHYESSELTAIYDNASRNGLVIGSVAHDRWKTGVYWSGSNERLDKLEVYGGFASPAATHDWLSHGTVSGTTVASPLIFVGYYPDYRDGLEGFGLANAAVAPPLAFGPDVPSGVPVGWNSWGAYSSELSYDGVVAVSEFFREHLQNESFTNNGNVYINLDSYWDHLTEEQLRHIVSVIRGNGQKAGIYHSPFVYWGSDMDRRVDGTDWQYTYGDFILRDADGNPLPTLAGGYAVDPTHPAFTMRLDYFLDKFMEYGFEYIKLDFLTHGALEGEHYDPEVQTGIEAYNRAMAYIEEKLDGTMFISASIAPLFPSQYAHARRISCDVDGTLRMTEYQLNNLTYGWWQNGTIYSYTDPDYMTLEKGGSLAAAQSRVNAAAISGTVYLNSDDVSSPTAQHYMKTLLTNQAVNDVALKGKAFRPVEGNTGTRSADAFVLQDGDNYYLAVFNFTDEDAVRTVDFRRAGIADGSGATITDVWTNESDRAQGQLTVKLAGAQSMLYKITPDGQ